jgi:tungstate transport system substrate-binding protein
MKIKYLIPILIILTVITLYISYQYMFPKKIILRISTTTSLYATGLLDVIADRFQEKHPNVVVQFIAVGSGEALRKASMGDADLVLVHAPNLEREYLEKDILIDGRIFAYNYFIIVGPIEDPAGIKGLENASMALLKIYEYGKSGEAIFVSRGDNSGTHNRELFLWNKLGILPEGDWYIESGTGMAQTLQIANEKRAYTLSDIGTYLKLKVSGVIDLEILVSGDPDLMNIYSAYIVNPDKINGINYDIAKEFTDFLTSEEGQSIIGKYGADIAGKSFFNPASPDKLDELKAIWEYFAYFK